TVLSGLRPEVRAYWRKDSRSWWVLGLFSSERDEASHRRCRADMAGLGGRGYRNAQLNVPVRIDQISGWGKGWGGKPQNGAQQHQHHPSSAAETATAITRYTW